MVEIGSDRELLARLGLTETQAADFLDRSRQAVNAALSSVAEGENRKRYFRAADILNLRLAARQLGKVVDDEAIVAYVRRHHGPNWAERVRTAFGILAEPPSFTEGDTLWIVIPDVFSLRRDWPQHAEFLKDLADPQRDLNVRYFCPSEVQESALRLFVLGEASLLEDAPRPNRFSPSFTCDGQVGGQPPLILNRRVGGDPEAYMLMPQGFVRAPLINGLSLEAYLLRLIKPRKLKKEDEAA